MGVPMGPEPVNTLDLLCPECGGESLETTEVLVGGCASTFFIEAGQRRIEPHGYTEVYWDTSISVGVFCKLCSWEHGSQEQPDIDGALAALLTPDQWEAKQQRGD